MSLVPYERGTCAYCGRNTPIYVPKDGDGRKKEGRKILSKYYSPLSGRYGSKVTNDQT
jgi:hypothetical protein